MADLSAFPVTSQWPSANPDILHLDSVPRPNGVKASPQYPRARLITPHPIG